MKLSDRIDLVKENWLCFCCLSNFHYTKKCNSKNVCSVCKLKTHQTLLQNYLKPLEETRNAGSQKNSDIRLEEIASNHSMLNEDYQSLNKNDEFICSNFISREKGGKCYI